MSHVLLEAVTWLPSWTTRQTSGGALEDCSADSNIYALSVIREDPFDDGLFEFFVAMEIPPTLHSFLGNSPLRPAPRA